MEELFNALQQRIAENMPSLRLIDEETGQLDGETGVYPVEFPCVLLSAPETEWENLGKEVQRGVCTLAVRLAFDCRSETPAPAPDVPLQMAERLQMAEQLHRLIHGQRFEGANGPVVRRKSTWYTLPGGVKVYETEYTAPVKG